jgi:23S rRNA pseudouridine1911/1915/1917 synthase
MKKSNTEPVILYEDNHLVIVNKSSGEIVQGDKTGDIPLSEIVSNYISTKFNKPGAAFIGVVHRLDRPVSGAVLFARTSKALTRLNAMLKNGEITKTYWAVVKSPPPEREGSLVHFLTRNESRNKTFVSEKEAVGSQRAELRYTVLASSNSFHLLSVHLLTGRHHQIRAQLAAIGCPIRGDLKYGYPRSNPDGSISLHAVSLEFIHPVSKILVQVNARPPHEAVWDAFVTLTGMFPTC